MTELPLPENRRSYPALFGFRALAVLFVFAQHYIGFGEAFNWRAGINVFFVLSGFLITGILYDTRDRPHRFRIFYVRRSLRILPLFYLVLLIGLALTPVFHWRWHPVWILWPLYIGNMGRFIWPGQLVHGTAVFDNLIAATPGNPFMLYFGHLWSLCVEEQFYLLWPLVVYFIKDRIRLRNICVASVILLPVARFLCSIYLPRNIIDAGLCGRIIFLQFDSLLLGGLLALSLRGPRPFSARTLSGRARPIALTLLAGTILFTVFYTRLSPASPGLRLLEPLMDSLGYTCINVLAAALIVLSIDPGTRVSRLLQRKPLLWLGSVSYGFYVFHELFHQAYERFAHLFPAKLNPYGLLTAMLAFTATLALSYISFRFFELPILRLKTRFEIPRRHRLHLVHERAA